MNGCRMAERGRWVLILDNVDDDHFLRRAPFIRQHSVEGDKNGSPDRPLWAYLPQSTHGSLMITTRNRAVALRMVEERDIITVHPMDGNDAQTLFEAKLGMPENLEGIMKLTAALEYMPLAIVQAASYIRQRAPRSSVKQYLQQFESSDSRKLSLLEHEDGRLRRDWEAKNSIIRTWQISFDHILQERPSAANLLALMSFFDRQGIHQCLLQDFSHVKTSNTDQERHPDAVDSHKMDNTDSLVQSNMDDRFEDDICTLRNFSFITANADAASFRMHRLVQLAMQKWLEAHGQLERWKLSFIRSLAREFPPGEFEDWAKCQLLYPHAKLAMLEQLDTEDSLALLLHKAAIYAWRKGDLNEAEDMAVKALKMRETLSGKESFETLNSINLLGLVLDDQGKYDEALVMHRRAVAGFKKLLGTDHHCSLVSLNNLGLVLRSRGEHEEAETMLRKALAGSEKILGLDHPTTLMCIGNLGTILTLRGKYMEAEILYREALSGFAKTCGDDHPSTLTSVHKLALVVKLQGRFDEAEMLYRRALAGYEKMAGIDHPDMLMSTSELGSVLGYQGKYQEAEVMNRQVLASYEKRLRANHPVKLAAMNNLASALMGQGKYEEAEGLLQQILTGSQEVFGGDHPGILTSVDNLGFALAGLGKYKDAETMHQRALAMRQKYLGAEHPDTLVSMRHLSDNWKTQGRDIEAIELLQRVVRLKCQSLGAEHPQTRSTMIQLNKWKVYCGGSFLFALPRPHF
jgi:tetratricopeptide (TPR) repeat protein